MSAMTRKRHASNRHASRGPRAATVYGEPIVELLPALAAICSGGRVLPAGPESGHDQDISSLSLTLPPSAGGSVRRALLRCQPTSCAARQTKSVHTRLWPPVCTAASPKGCELLPNSSSASLARSESPGRPWRNAPSCWVRSPRPLPAAVAPSAERPGRLRATLTGPLRHLLGFRQPRYASRRCCTSRTRIPRASSSIR